MAGFDDRNVIGLLKAAVEDRFEQSYANEVSLFNGSSDRAEETYGFFGGFPAMREWIGARQGQVIAQKSYAIRNKEYESTLVVKQKDLDRDKSTLLEAYVNSYAEGVVQNHWEDLIIDLVNTNGLCYDGQNFFDTDHLWGDSGTQQNEVDSSDLPDLNVGTATAPTATEMANVLMALAGHMMTFKDNKGRDVNGSAREFLVAVSTVPLFTAATQAINSVTLTGNTDNPLKGFMMAGFKFKPKLITRLTSATAKVRLFRTDGMLKPFLLQEEQAIEYDTLGRGSDHYFETKEIKIGLNARRGAGYGLWEHAISGTLN